MSDERVNMEVDGRAVTAAKGAMLIEITDQQDIYVPRFCYHPELSIAANCRMCLVEVENAPKPLPACATPVAEGMKVYTRSPLALDAQKSTMEFLLINHPLDCPICDQGGECELQDLAMGYGSDVSRYTEGKRVVKDKNIGPLVQTDMTRCIHCTRCVRFGEEIAGMRELGATGRSEHMEIGTYVERAMKSELSGNVIDICPVGALTNKPFRYSARAWELRQADGIAAHDCVGSHVHYHTAGQRVKRAVPKRCDELNEVWLADRDRYSCHGLYDAQRLTEPCIKRNGEWRNVEWDSALEYITSRLGGLREHVDAGRLGALTAPTATVEECYLLQRLVRGLGSNNIDHRLRQIDFSDQQSAPPYPWLGCELSEIEECDVVLLVGSYPRHEQPLLNHRLRRAALRGARIAAVHNVDLDFNYEVAHKLVIRPSDMVPAMMSLLKALTGQDAERSGDPQQEAVAGIAADLRQAKRPLILLGPGVHAHPQAALLRAASGLMARLPGHTLGHLTDGPNSAGAWLAGAVPHRGPGAVPIERPGHHVAGMLESGLDALLLLGLDPELDSWDPARMVELVEGTPFVVAMAAYQSPVLSEYCDVLLPLALPPENEGCYVNCCGRWQSFQAAAPAPGEARMAWRILRVLGNAFELSGFEQQTVEDVRAELAESCDGAAPPDQSESWQMPATWEAARVNGLQRITVLPAYSTDPLVRHSQALQDAQAEQAGCVRVHPHLARLSGVRAGEVVRVAQGGGQSSWRLAVDERVPEDCVLVPAGQPQGRDLGGWFGEVVLKRGP